jgi:membrane-associated phospholipid phosphatase
MTKAEGMWYVYILIGIMFCSQRLLSQQIESLSANILNDTLSLIRISCPDYDEDDCKIDFYGSDSALLKQELTLPFGDYRFLSPEHIPAADSVYERPKWFVASMLEDQRNLWTSPLRIRKTDLKFWIPVIVSTGVTIVYDEEIYSSIKNFQNDHAWISDISPIITQLGDDPFVLGTGGLFFLSGVLSGNMKIKQTGLIALQTWFHTGFIARVGKLLFGRQRPSYENGIDKWRGFPESLKMVKGEPSSKYDAFPSGHTIEVFGLATVIAEQYKDIKIIPVISYTLATGTALSRITEDTHWLSDVILGAALGYGVGKYMVRERKHTQWTLLPIFTKDELTLTAIYRF